MWLRRWLSLALLAGVIMLPSVSKAQEQAEPAIAPVPAPISGLLDSMGRAWLDRDRALLSQTLLPGGFADGQLRSFDNAAEVSFSMYRMRATTRFSANLAWPRVIRLYPGMEVAAFHVVQETAVRGVERVPYVESGFYTFVRRTAEPGDPFEGWRMSSDSDFEPLGAHSPVPLWEGGPVRVLTSDRFVLLAHPDRVEQVRDTLGLSETAYDQAQGFWPRRTDERYVILVPSSSEELGQMIHATIDLSKFVAFASRTSRIDDEFTPAGVRMFIHLDRFVRYDEAGRQGILAHELIHAITTPVSGPFVPIWVEEGLAMHGSEPGSGVRAARRGPAPDEFPTSDQFYVGALADIVRTYARSQVAFEVLEAQRGREAVARFYESLGSVRVAPGTSEHHVRRATESDLGWSVDEWTKAWRDRL